MSSKETNSKIWKKYFSGELSEKEKTNFENIIENDEFSKEALEGFQAFQEEGGDVSANIATINSKIEQRTGYKREEKKPIPLFKIFAAAASLLIIIGGVFFTTRLLDNKNQVAQKEEIVENDETTQKEKKSISDDIILYEDASKKTTDLEDNISNDSEPTVVEVEKPNEEVIIDAELEEEDLFYETPTEDPIALDVTETIKSTEQIEYINNEVAQVTTVDKEEELRAPQTTSNKNIENSLSLGEQPATENEFNKGLNFYLKKDYDQAIDWFEKSINNKDKLSESYYYIGLSYYFQDKKSKALKAFSELLDTPSTLSDNAKWYSALIYIEKGKKTDAKNILNDLIDGNSSFKKQAQEKINNL